MKISVIIPVYNAEKYLDECLQSVLKQSFIDFELLLINDGSTDESGTICNSYAADDNRIKVFHKENGGVSSARNLGLNHAKGEWITFVDSDDWVSENYFSCFEMEISKEVDWIFLNLTKKVLNGNDVEITFNKKTLKRNMFLEKYKVHPHFFGPTAKFYRNSIIQENHIKFDEKLNFGEDNLFNCEFLMNVNYIKLFGENFYYRRPSLEGLSKSKPNLLNDEYKYIRLYKVLKEKGLTNKIINNNLEMSISRYFTAIIASDLSFKEKRSKILLLFNRHHSVLASDFEDNLFYKYLIKYKMYVFFIIVLQFRKKIIII